MIVFLDVDGVLNCQHDWKKPYSLNDNCVREFKKFLSSLTNCRLILISSWRAGFNFAGSSGNAEQIKVLEKALAPFRIAGKTLKLSCRDAEIEEFVARCNVKEYVIVDDDPKEYGRLHPYFCNCKNGWTTSDTTRCLKQLRS